AGEPRPDGSLVVGAVPLPWSAFVTADVGGIRRRQRSQTERRRETRLDGVDDAPSGLALEDREREPADGEDLVRPDRGIRLARPVIRVHHVVETPRRLVPESLVESGEAPVVEVSPPVGERRRRPERVEPERLYFDGLADPRGDDPVADFGVHPGQLHARL